jgi:uncharacterized protein (DUF885 family)
VGLVRDLADQYVVAHGALDPYQATSLGLPGHDHELADLSPDGDAARADLARSTLQSLSAIERSAPVTDRDDLLCAALLRDRLSLRVQMVDAYENLRGLRTVGSELESVISCFEAMTPTDDEQWATFVARIEALPACLASYESSLREGMSRGLLSAPRQAVGVAEQVRAWAHDSGTGYFGARLASAPESITGRAEGAVAAARESLDGLERFLLTDYRAAADATPDAVGRDRYGLHVRQHLGAVVDVDDASQWAWGELERIEADMRGEAHALKAGLSVDEAFAWLDEHGDAAHGEAALIEFLQTLMDETIPRCTGYTSIFPNRFVPCRR